jgi:hypothetical protein
MHPPPSPGDTFDAFTSILTRSVMCCFRRFVAAWLLCSCCIDLSTLSECATCICSKLEYVRSLAVLILCMT